MIHTSLSDIQGICDAVHESHKQFVATEYTEVRTGGCVVTLRDIPDANLTTIQGWIRRAGGICHYVSREYAFDRWVLRTYIK